MLYYFHSMVDVEISMDRWKVSLIIGHRKLLGPQPQALGQSNGSLLDLLDPGECHGYSEIWTPGGVLDPYAGGIDSVDSGYAASRY
jgi:hypothetical protein